MQRRERTRHLIELGGLVVKAGLVEITDDDRAVILGGLLTVADKLSGDESENALTLWRRRGHRKFESDAIDKTSELGEEGMPNAWCKPS